MSPPHVFLVPAIVYPPLPAANSESIVPGAERLIGGIRLPQSSTLTLQIPLQPPLISIYPLFPCFEPKVFLKLDNMIP